MHQTSMTTLPAIAVLALAAVPAVACAQDDPPAEPAAEPAPTPEPESEPKSIGDAVVDMTIGPDEPDDEAVRTDAVVVTARKWSEILQDVPMPVTVIDLDDVISGGVADVNEAVSGVPNLYMSEFSARRLSFPFLRGIGSGQGDPAVNTYIDGVPQLTASSTNIPLLDVERVEFLRGPQGTLYGRNALGGLINIKTRRPSTGLRLKWQGAFGNYDLNQNAWGLEFGNGDIAAGLSYMKSTREGYTTNTAINQDVDHRNTEFWRGQIVFTPTDEDEFHVSVYGEHSRDGGFALYDADALEVRPHELAQDFDGDTERDIVAPSVTWTHVGDALEFTSISGYNDWDIRELSDFDFTVIDGVRRETIEEQEYFSQEFRIGSAQDAGIELGDDVTMRWQFGVQGFSSDAKRSAENDFRPGGAGILFPPTAVGQDMTAGDFDDVGFAAFGQAVFTVHDQWDFTVGLRYDYEDKQADTTHTFTSGGFVVVDEQFSFDESYDEWLPEAAIAWRPSERGTVYGRVARAFKAGGFNLSAPAGSEAFDPETSWTYEIGAKSLWADNRLSLNGAIFYIDWSDMQLSQFDAVRGGYVQNAGESNSYGAEIEAAYAITDDIEVYSNLGWLQTEIDQYIDPYGTDTAGNDLPFAPETTFTIGARVGGKFGRGGLRWYASAEYVNIGDFYFEAGNRRSESYDLANFRAGVGKGRFRVEGWMRNAFDEEYLSVAFQPSPVDPTAFVGENGAPQTYGVTVSIGF